jgi:phage FluMu protein Com
VSNHSFLDGNAAAGELSELFSVDVTAAAGRCAACGKVAALGEGHLYAFEPGMVIRCAACLNPLVRLVKASGRAWLDMRGLACLQITLIQSEVAGVSQA